MEGRRIILNDGSTFEGNCGYADGYLWCYLLGVKDPEDLAPFLNPDAISVIIYQYGDMEDRYTGFVFEMMQKTDSGYNVCLKKGAA